MKKGNKNNFTIFKKLNFKVTNGNFQGGKAQKLEGDKEAKQKHIL